MYLGKALANVPVALAIGIRSAAYRLRRLAFRDAMRPSCERSQGSKSSAGRCERWVWEADGFLVSLFI